jgi:hypothetical protein
MRKTDLRAFVRIVLLLAALAAALPLCADDQLARAAFGVNKAPALEALVANLWPGSQLQWQPLTIVGADKKERLLRIGDVVERKEADGSFTFVFALEFPEGEEQLLADIAAFRPVTTTSRSEIVACKTTAAFAITAVRRAYYNDTATVTQTNALELAVEGADLPWPKLFMRYRAVYVTADWFGEIDWQGKLSTDPIAVEQRLPGMLSRVMKDGGQRTEEPIVLPTEDDTIVIASKLARRILSNCAVPCMPDGKVLLGLW